jgi:hypothetical protein
MKLKLWLLVCGIRASPAVPAPPVIRASPAVPVPPVMPQSFQVHVVDTQTDEPTYAYTWSYDLVNRVEKIVCKYIPWVLDKTPHQHPHPHPH